jgi:hypothetical protein
MTVLDGRAPRSAVMSFAGSRSFVTIPDDGSITPARVAAGRVVQNRSSLPRGSAHDRVTSVADLPEHRLAVAGNGVRPATLQKSDPLV